MECGRSFYFTQMHSKNLNLSLQKNLYDSCNPSKTSEETLTQDFYDTLSLSNMAACVCNYEAYA